MPKEKIATTDWKKDQWQYELPFNCKKVLKVWIDNKEVEWRIIKMLDIDFYQKGKKLKIKYIINN